MSTAQKHAEAPSEQMDPSSADPPACAAWVLEYSLAANLRITDTPMGGGDGIYRIGPGALVLRFENEGGSPGGNVKMISYEVREPVSVVSTVMFLKTKITSNTTTRKEPDACDAPPEGRLTHDVLEWRRAVPAFRSDGTVTCEGAFCGTYGAPPAGSTPFHIEPHATKLSSFQFSRDLSTFTMPWTLIAKTEAPKQTAFLTLSGRQVRRTCARLLVCR